MTIAYQKLTDNFTIIANAGINDARLGLEALAIFAYLRSKPRDWVVRPNEISARFKAGRDRVRKALNQLVECGYVGKAQTRDPATGRLGPVDYLVRALPEGVPAAPAEVEITAAPSPETPSPEIPSTEIRSLLSTDLLPSTDSTKEDNIHRAASAADARCPGVYRQSPAEAACAWEELQKLDGWCGTWEDDPLIHWHALLRKGYAADDIVNVAEDYLLRSHDVPSLGDWLACFETYLEDAERVAIDQPTHRLWQQRNDGSAILQN